MDGYNLRVLSHNSHEESECRAMNRGHEKHENWQRIAWMSGFAIKGTSPHSTVTKPHQIPCNRKVISAVFPSLSLPSVDHMCNIIAWMRKAFPCRPRRIHSTHVQLATHFSEKEAPLCLPGHFRNVLYLIGDSDYPRVIIQFAMFTGVCLSTSLTRGEVATVP